MNEYFEKAVKKLDDGEKEIVSQKGRVMKAAVKDALKEFSRQDAEFAQAVVQGGSFKDCMDAVEKKIKGNAISDLDAFTAAASFYFPGCGIRVQMTIDLCASVDSDPQDVPGAVVLDLASFF